MVFQRGFRQDRKSKLKMDLRELLQLYSTPELFEPSRVGERQQHDVQCGEYAEFAFTHSLSDAFYNA